MDGIVNKNEGVYILDTGGRPGTAARYTCSASPSASSEI